MAVTVLILPDFKKQEFGFLLFKNLLQQYGININAITAISKIDNMQGRDIQLLFKMFIEDTVDGMRRTKKDDICILFIGMHTIEKPDTMPGTIFF
jgi:hypothetical protein